MQIEYKEIGNTCIIYISGELDENTAVYTRNKLDEILRSQKCSMQVIFDFSGLTFMDSTGIGVLLGRYKKFDKYGISFAVRNANRHIDKILKMTGIYSIIPNIA